MMLIFFPPYATAFVGDDYVQLDYVLEFVKRPFSLFEVFNPYWTGWYYRPLQNVWFFLNRTLFGYNPFGYYWMGLLAHGMAVAMMVAVARKVGLRWETAVTCGVLFAIQKHYVDVVTWISAIAILLAGLFSMAALAAYTKYLRKGNGRDLALTFLFFLLTLFSHEEAFFLPPLLLLWHFLFNSKKAADNKRILLSISLGQWAFWGVSAALLGSYLFFQITRTNLTISVQDTVAVGGWQLLTPLPLSQFITDTVGKFVPIPGLATWLMPYSYGVAFLAVGLLAVWFWQGNKLVRLGIAWAVLHLAFIYGVLWMNKPELYAGRHIYQAWIGLVLALGAGIEGLLLNLKTHKRRKGNGRFLTNAIGLVILVGLISSVSYVRQVQANWLADTGEEDSARRQLQALLPEIDDTMHIFAYRFPITPNFLRSVIQVWYGRDEPYQQPFGPIERLQSFGQATPDYYVLDWDENGRLYNLMPELQGSPRTVFVWSTPLSVTGTVEETTNTDAAAKQILSVAGPEMDRRLAVKQEPDPEGEWRGLAYEVTVPEGGVLKTAVRRGSSASPDTGNLRFRLLLDVTGAQESLLDLEIAAGDQILA